MATEAKFLRPDPLRRHEPALLARLAVLAVLEGHDEDSRPQLVRWPDIKAIARSESAALSDGMALAVIARRVPAFPHELLVDIFRNGGEVVRVLLRACADIKLGKLTAETASIDLSQVVFIEYRADNVTVFWDCKRKPVFAVVVEI